MILLLLAFLISVGLVAYMLPRILILSLRKRLFDPIDPRKVHSVPASRLGGVTFFPVILFSSWLCISFATLFAPLFGVYVNIDVDIILETMALLLLFLIGVYDDVLGVSYKKKFLVQIFASAIIISSGTYFTTLHGLFGVGAIPTYIGVPLTMLFYVFVINALNLIDGIDGLASLLSIIALIVYGILLYLNDLIVDSLVAFATLGALVPFCYHNIFGIKRGAKSKIFMGDTGALVIGAILAFTAVTVWNIPDFSLPVDGARGHICQIMTFTVLLVPCLDVCRIVLHRWRDHKPLFKPDKNHIHHKLMAFGVSAHFALGAIIGIDAFFITMNILLSFMVDITYVLMIDIVIWVILHCLLTRKIGRLNIEQKK